MNKKHTCMALLLVLPTVGFTAAVWAGMESSCVPVNSDTNYTPAINEQNLIMEARVDSAGVINYSFLGALNVCGHATEQIEQTGTEFSKLEPVANLSAKRTEAGNRLLHSNGEIKQSGGYSLVSGPNLEQALAMTEELTNRASKHQMLLIKGSSSDNQRKRVKLTVSIDPGDTNTIEEGFF